MLQELQEYRRHATSLIVTDLRANSFERQTFEPGWSELWLVTFSVRTFVAYRAEPRLTVRKLTRSAVQIDRATQL